MNVESAAAASSSIPAVTSNQKYIVDLSDIKDSVRDALRSKSSLFYSMSKKVEFDGLLVALSEYFKRYLKNYQSKNDSSWLVQKFKSRVSLLQGGAFSKTLVNNEEIDIAYKTLGTKYSMWLISFGHNLNGAEEIKMFNTLILFFNMLLKKIFTNRGDSALIEFEVDRLFNSGIGRSQSNGSKERRSNISGIYKTHSPLIALLYPNSQEQNLRPVLGRPIDSVKITETEQIHLEFKDYDNMEIVIGLSNTKKRRPFLPQRS